MRRMARDLIRRVELVALILGVFVTAGSVITLDPKVIGGVFIGAAFGWLNLAVVRLLFERGAREPERKSTMVGAFLIKSAILIGLIAAVVIITGIDGLGFIIGYSVSVVAVLVVPMVSFLFGGGKDAPPGESSENAKG